MQKLEELKEHYEKNFRNNNEISRKISIIEENISNYFVLEDYLNFKSQKVNKKRFLFLFYYFSFSKL